MEVHTAVKAGIGVETAVDGRADGRAPAEPQFPAGVDDGSVHRAPAVDIHPGTVVDRGRFDCAAIQVHIAAIIDNGSGHDPAAVDIQFTGVVDGNVGGRRAGMNGSGIFCKGQSRKCVGDERETCPFVDVYMSSVFHDIHGRSAMLDA